MVVAGNRTLDSGKYTKSCMKFSIPTSSFIAVLKTVLENYTSKTVSDATVFPPTFVELLTATTAFPEVELVSIYAGMYIRLEKGSSKIEFLRLDFTAGRPHM